MPDKSEDHNNLTYSANSDRFCLVKIFRKAYWQTSNTMAGHIREKQKPKRDKKNKIIKNYYRRCQHS